MIFFSVLARLAFQLKMVQSFALRSNPGVCPSCSLHTLGTHRPMQD